MLQGRTPTLKVARVMGALKGGGGEGTLATSWKERIKKTNMASSREGKSIFVKFEKRLQVCSSCI